MKPSIPKGTRDFSSAELAKRNYIFDTIKRSFQLFGFEPIETPSFENSSTLMGKYGEEGDRLIFKILNSGDFLRKVDDELYQQKDATKLTARISEKALRYDLTVPFARYVVQRQNEISFPFKRYQIQPVWRADRPQKGRFREFYQCDADVVGSDSLWQEVEFVQLYDAVFSDLGLKGTVIKMNNRKILSGIAEIIGAKDKLIDFTVALDKLDKIGVEGVLKEMRAKEISEEALDRLMPLFDLKGSNKEQLDALKDLLAESEEGLKGIEELSFVIEQVEQLGLKSSVLDLDLTLARGLNYYTGAIFEVKATEVQMGSIGGGGRYDDLTGIFGLKGISGVGISFGLDRIYLVMEELGLFSNTPGSGPEVLFINFGTEEAAYSMKALKELRNAGIRAEMYPSSAKLKKQMNYANNRSIPYVILVGQEEMAEGVYKLKNMATGEQNSCNLNDLIRLIGS
ncbi:histidine--tRNA ligase [Lutimonas saemankumensis]|uniref:histidine--tRNA ligase n=1 Tax=Lutimonas saemankumensis TaxID=483016 RepID=UPI001CD3BDD4|nr:histidine--tRNA ligase [Lutimonas saemankumensis]MCA0931702.1 histidine--tRNA ligase [Lutimonas saemankumensis]